MLPFHITRKVAIRHKKRREAICFMVERIAIIYIESEVQTMRTEKNELNVQIGKRLQTVRENSGYTQEAFAEVLDIGVEHYRKIELGMYGLQRENMLILYKKYKIDPTYLLTGEKNHTFDVEMFLANCILVSPIRLSQSGKMVSVVRIFSCFRNLLSFSRFQWTSFLVTRRQKVLEIFA